MCGGGGICDRHSVITRFIQVKWLFFFSIMKCPGSHEWIATMLVSSDVKNILSFTVDAARRLY